jgi:hypothetical protein
MFSEDQLFNLNKRGVFPGPNESDENFISRARSLDFLDLEPKALELFDASADWVEVRLSAKGLLPWEGAATWIEETTDGKRSASIQIKPSLPSFLYAREEVAAHEMAHAMRLMFDEPRFEEILAFQTSKNRFRRYFGPLFSHPTEVKIFVSMMLFSWVAYGMEWIFDLNLIGNYLLFSPLLALALGVLRLYRSQKVFAAALTHLAQAIKNPRKSLAVALRLSDTEIQQFARYSPEEILSFAKKEKENTLRWKQLYLSYFT